MADIGVLRLTVGLLGVSAAVIQVEHWIARRRLGLPTSPALRSATLALASLAAVLSQSALGTALAFSLLGTLTIIALRQPAGLDTADSELWVFLAIGCVGLSVQRRTGLALEALVISFAAIYFFAGLNKLRSPQWRSGRALALITAADRTWPSRVLEEMPLRTHVVLCHLVIGLQLVAPALALSSSTRLLGYLLIVMFQAGVALAVGISSFLLVVLALAPVMWQAT